MKQYDLNPGCYTSPSGSDLLWWLSSHLIEQQKPNALIILPTQKAANRLQRILYKKNPDVLNHIKILTYETLDTETSYDTASTELVWHVCESSHINQTFFKTVTPTFKQRQQFVTTLSNTLTELYTHEITPKQLTQKLNALSDNTLQDFVALFQAYDDLLKHNNKLHPAQALIQKIKTFHHKVPTTPGSIYLIIDGPTPPCLQELAADLCKEHYVLIYGNVSDQPSPGYALDSCYTSLNAALKKHDIQINQLPTYVPRKPLLEHIQQAVFEPINLSSHFEGVKTHESPNELILAQEIIAIATHYFQQNINTVTLITPNRQLAKIVGISALNKGVAVDDSYGTSLSETPLGYIILELLKWIESPKNYKQLLNVVMHPLLKTYWQDFPAKFDAWGRRQQLTFMDALKSYTPQDEHENEHLIELTQVFNTPKPPSFSDCIVCALKCLKNWNFEAENYPEYSEVTHLISVASSTEMLNFLLQTTIFRIPTPQGPRIQIIGPLEVRLTQPQVTIIANLNEGEWPAASSSSPWLYSRLKSNLNLPRPDEITGVYSKILLSLLGCKHVHLCRQTHAKGQPLRPSRWWERLRVLTKLNHLDISTAYYTPPQFQQPSTDSHKFKIPAELLPKRLSISGLHTLINDPQKFILQYILKLEELPPWEAPADNRDKGILVHSILETALKNNLSVDKMITLAQQKLDQLTLSIQDRTFWAEQIKEYVHHFHDLHKHTAPQQTWMETKAEWVIHTQFGPLTLVGKADRIDQMPDGSIHIIDYKTGSIPTKQSVYKGSSPQLPLLGLMLQYGAFKILPAQDPFMVSYWDLKEGTAQHFLFEELKHLEQHFISIIENLLNPDTVFELTPDV
ncbi:MAG: PD-(D/E)XK nuclease family protein [Candidatus Paracaedibacteraceae bacterium]|nr:PD-(D/E)XK nuclease family protein [Candidatus Paracaedibacteraceae bacterium]